MGMSLLDVGESVERVRFTNSHVTSKSYYLHFILANSQRYPEDDTFIYGRWNRTNLVCVSQTKFSQFLGIRGKIKTLSRKSIN